MKGLCIRLDTNLEGKELEFTKELATHTTIAVSLLSNGLYEDENLPEAIKNIAKKNKENYGDDIFKRISNVERELISSIASVISSQVVVGLGDDVTSGKFTEKKCECNCGKGHEHKLNEDEIIIKKGDIVATFDEMLKEQANNGIDTAIETTVKVLLMAIELKLLTKTKETN